jgi:hypothetical protein
MMHEVYLVLLIAAPAMAAFRIVLFYHTDALYLVGGVAVVLINWAANTAWVIHSGDTDPVLMFAATDLASMGVLSMMGECRFAKTLETTYFGQVTLHALHLLGAGKSDFYWSLLTAIGYLQFAILAAWACAPSRRRQLEDWLR